MDKNLLIGILIGIIILMTGILLINIISAIYYQPMGFMGERMMDRFMERMMENDGMMERMMERMHEECERIMHEHMEEHYENSTEYEH